VKRVPRVAGFSFSGLHCGLKPCEPDLALLVSDRPAAAAGVFTRSSIPGAPVVVSKQHLRAGRIRGVVANSGIANVGLGVAGLRRAEEMAALAAGAIGCRAAELLVASTGVIGKPLPVAPLRRGIRRAVAALASGGLGDAARAIMTTDTVPKVAGRRFQLRSRQLAVAGIAKGSGMIEPRMATMLAFLVTDAAVAPAFLRRLWREVTADTFNRVTVDGETSTSDTALLLANGASGGHPIAGPRSPGARLLREALHAVAAELARELARDGEGATKLVRVEVQGARSHADTERAARRIANSLLVKTALFGGDPNWGRILQTVGAAEISLDLARTEVRLCGVAVFRAGAATGPAARRRAGAKLGRREIEIEVRLGRGRGRAQLWTCDLSDEYVRINAEYTT